MRFAYKHFISYSGLRDSFRIFLVRNYALPIRHEQFVTANVYQHTKNVPLWKYPGKRIFTDKCIVWKLFILLVISEKLFKTITVRRRSIDNDFSRCFYHLVKYQNSTYTGMTNLKTNFVFIFFQVVIPQKSFQLGKLKRGWEKNK